MPRRLSNAGRPPGARGASLAELMVVMFLFLLLGYCVYVVVSRGLNFYLDSATALEVRQEALVGMSRMTRELRESSLATVHVEDPGPPVGLVFASPRNSQGDLQPSDDGKLGWRTYICYYTGPLGDQQALYRQEQALSAPVFRPPDPYAETPPRNPAFFSVLASPPPRLICRRLESVIFTADTDTVKIKINCSLSTRYTYRTQLRTKVVPRF